MRLRRCADAPVQVGIATVPAVRAVHRVVSGTDLPRRRFEQRIHRRQRHDIHQLEAFQASLVSPVVMTEVEAHHFDLRAGSVADFWIEQVVVASAHGQFFEELVLPPAGPNTDSRGLVPQFWTLGERSNGGFRGGYGESAPCDEQGTLAVTGGGARRRVGRSEEHTSELQSPCNLVCRLLLEKKKKV